MCQVATNHDPIMMVEDQRMLKAQRTEKLRKLEEVKESNLQKLKRSA